MYDSIINTLSKREHIYLQLKMLNFAFFLLHVYPRCPDCREGSRTDPQREYIGSRESSLVLSSNFKEQRAISSIRAHSHQVVKLELLNTLSCISFDSAWHASLVFTSIDSIMNQRTSYLRNSQLKEIWCDAKTGRSKKMTIIINDAHYSKFSLFNCSVKHVILNSFPSFVSPPHLLAVQIEQSSQRYLHFRNSFKTNALKILSRFSSWARSTANSWISVEHS